MKQSEASVCECERRVLYNKIKSVRYDTFVLHSVKQRGRSAPAMSINNGKTFADLCASSSRAYAHIFNSSQDQRPDLVKVSPVATPPTSGSRASQ